MQPEFSGGAAYNRRLEACLVVIDCRWLLLPVPKVASTLLKRLAVIADGRDPAALAVLGETRPALAIHRPDLHQLPNLTQLPGEQRVALLSDPHVLRLAVTRHPGERLISFWHDKLHLADPAYSPLNAAVQALRSRDRREPCRFSDFLTYLGDHWEELRSDGHLMPQREWLGDGALFNRVLDRDHLPKQLPSLLEPLLVADRIQRLRQELQIYDQQHRQRLGKRWEQSYSKAGLELLEHLYGDDLKAYSYELPRHRPDRVRPLAAIDLDALVDPLQQLRDRHQQIAGLQEQILQLQQELTAAQQALEQPPLPALAPPAGQWPPHNCPEAGLAHLYDALSQQRFKEVLDQASGLQHHSHAGEVAYLEGLARSALQQQELALCCFEAAQARGFLTPYVLFNAANACRALGNAAEGIRLYREALAMFPNFAECRHNLALGLIEVGEVPAAERELRLLLRDQPSYAQASFCLANLLRDRRREREAIEAFNLCIQHAPAFADAWNNLGLAQASLADLEAAMASYRHALTIDAAFKPSRQNLAQALVQAKRHEEALEQFSLFANLELNTFEHVVALQGQLTCLLELDRYDDALALADDNADRRLQLMNRLHVLPVLYASDTQVEAVRQRWGDDAREIYGLLEGLEQSDPAWGLLYAHAWSLTNFYLAYQMDDDRHLQELYAGILDRILRPRLGAFMQPRPQRHPADTRPLRVGVISPHLHNHNGSIWCLGWLEGIARNPGYEIFTYNLAERIDSGTERFAALGTQRQLPLRAENPEPMLLQILDDQLDLLIYTDIGMHPASKITSVMQLAPVQVQGWGHPITSGSRTIHYYLSGEGMEPPGNEDHYSETLYRLPRTGLNYETPAALHDGQLLYDKFKLPLDRPILTSMQSTFKYLPRNDWTFAEICARHHQALIVLVGHMGSGGIAERLYERMRPHFEQRGLVIEQQLRILPRLDYGDFMGLFAIAHHTIDTIDWNGGNSSMQSFSLDCPVVTLPTAFMRGRHTVAMLEVLEIPELIAHDRDEYVAISCRLLEDQRFYNDVKERIRERKQRLFHDKGVAEAFQIAVETICRQRPLVGQQPTKIVPLPTPPLPAPPAQELASA
jgi:predicted O-linked N-acetylglucosamine transferase (SPINDLY family)